MVKTILRCKEPIYDFDWSSIILVLKKQLENVYDAVFVNGYCIHSKKHERSLRICIKLCERILKNDYSESGYLAPYIDWETEVFILKKSKNISINGEQLYEIVLKDHIPIRSFMSDKVESTFKLQEKIQKYDLDLLFKLVRKHIRYWHD